MKKTSIQKLTEFERLTVFGKFNVISFMKEDNIFFALTRGIFPKKDLLVRIQSPCLFGESFGVETCDCGAQLREALKIGSEQENFLLVYLSNQEGRGIGLLQKLFAINEEVAANVNMYEAFERLKLPHDIRDYTTAGEIINELNQGETICLLTNNPKKTEGLKKAGVIISKVIPHFVPPTNEECKNYLITKKNHLGHLLPDDIKVVE